jgi:hypothetical protein
VKLHYPFGPAPEGSDVLWRCEAKRYSVVIDPDADRYGVTPPRLEMCWWHVHRRTPKGAWIGGKFILLTATKRWACETEAEALESFKARKRKQISILTSKLKDAERELALTEPNHVELFA